MERQARAKPNIYQSIVAEFKNLIELGALAYGEKLPSCRAYGYDRGINPNTVEKAYAELEREGYIQIQPKKGAYVSYMADEGAGRAAALEEQLRALKNSGIAREEIERAIEKVYRQEENEK